MLPEVADVRRVVRMPVLVLRAGQRVQVDDGVQAVARARVDHPVELVEPALDQLERTRVALEVPVVDRDAHAVHPGVGEELRVGVAEEHGEQSVEERVVEILSEHRQHVMAHERLVRGIAGDEVLHVHPAAEADAPQPHLVTVAVEQPTASRTQVSVR